ncbi:uncharacterized protein LOC120089408 [Benincasa hispida]|uniref:uncharacterized protein LOC120089408 n=1 Tax=Benincasa hispida TaxID=102211 RepID=UPI00190184C8|nr:uncharacterized protein LOC120089408 [Benincasa hispida]
MLEPNALPLRKAELIPTALYKQRSWSPDASREEAWQRRKGRSKKERKRSVTAEDLEELKACLELGFGFESPELDSRLSNTFPALELYHAVNKNYNDSISKSANTTAFSSPDRDYLNSPSPLGSPLAIFGSSGENPKAVKTKLRQWAQVVACSVKNSST